MLRNCSIITEKALQFDGLTPANSNTLVRYRKRTKMSNIVSFKDFKQDNADKIRARKNGSFFDAIDKYVQMLQDKQSLLEFMAEETETLIRSEGMNPDEFVLSPAYYHDFLITDMNIDIPEEGVYVELVFHNVSENRIISACTFASPQEGGEVSLTHQMYMLEGYKEGNREWLGYNFEEKLWQKGPGLDCFNLNLILEEQK